MPEPVTKPIIGNTRDQELLERADYSSYSHTPQGDLGFYCFKPTVEVANPNKLPAIIFFHGGAFDQRLTAQYATHCLHFANRGMLAFSLEYRVSSLYETTPKDAMEDARNFLSYLSQNQEKFGVDLDNIILAGSSSGGFLALHLASRHKSNLPYLESLPQPKGLVLFAPLSNIAPRGGTLTELFPDPKEAKALSPLKQVVKNSPALLVFHGKEDQVIPFSQSQKLVKKWSRKKNIAELVDFETGRHIDFNLNVNPELYELTLKRADHFLTELDILKADPDAFPH